MNSDPYIDTSFCAERLFREWKKHQRLIIAVDFDDTVYDFHNTGASHERIRAALNKCKELDFYIVMFTASAVERYPLIMDYMSKEYGIEPVSINKNPFPLPYGNNGKIYYNLLLDDRAGLGSALSTLERLFDLIKESQRKKVCEVIYAPNPYQKKHPLDCLSYRDSNWVGKIFLGGTIDNGDSEDWQSRVIAAMRDYDVTFLNPRRPDWDASWHQSKDNPKFREQVEWELGAIQSADTVTMYFAENSKSPITLLELGLFAQKKKPVVYCPQGFWRKGNVDIVCEQFGINVHETWSDFIEGIKKDFDVANF